MLLAPEALTAGPTQGCGFIKEAIQLRWFDSSLLGRACVAFLTPWGSFTVATLERPNRFDANREAADALVREARVRTCFKAAI